MVAWTENRDFVAQVARLEPHVRRLERAAWECRAWFPRARGQDTDDVSLQAESAAARDDTWREDFDEAELAEMDRRIGRPPYRSREAAFDALKVEARRHVGPEREYEGGFPILLEYATYEAVVARLAFILET